MTDYTNIVSTEELTGLLSRADVKLFDASYAIGGDGPKTGFEQGHIQGAQFFDIDDIADPDAPIAHTLPAERLFEEKVRALGINSGDQIVVYDQSGMALAASRAWWMFRVFGHDRVAVLDGGLPKWAAENRPLQNGPASTPVPGNFKARFRKEIFLTAKDVLANITTGAALTVDARDPGRFEGTAAEPRPGMESGHIPGSVNLFFMNLLKSDKTLKDPADLRAELENADVPQTGRPLISSCGSGVTACVLALALHRLGNPDVAVYGGSWTEWGQNPALPKEKGSVRKIGPHTAGPERG